MMGGGPPPGPDAETVTATILERYPETKVARTMGAAFFSLDEQHWPNYATIVTTDEHDIGAPSDLSARQGTFRLNIGLGRTTYQRLVGAMADAPHTAFDTIMPHPVYAKQHWVSVLNPSARTFHDVILPLIAQAHDRLAAQNTRRRG